ncbi:MAG: glucosamine-6-phosphate isomerase [Verrucomicrobia bacterium]|nr:glucosamine-6-phosphate isomerase [Verrucomicrobiota bacterium]
MNAMFPEYLRIPEAEIGLGQPVRVIVKGDMASVGQAVAEAMFWEIEEADRQGRGATLIVPVGPVDQYPMLAQKINQSRLSCRETAFIMMDEYLAEDDRWIAEEHPLSFRGYLNRLFYQRLDPALAPLPENRVVPDPSHPVRVADFIAARGGVDACFGGIGINGHLAFNEPPAPGETCSVKEFAARPTRVLSLTRETRTINSVTVGGELSVIPKRAVTVGMKEILAARRLRFYCNRPWQSAVVRRALHGSITPECPASLLRTHPDVVLTIAEYVAATPEIRLR